MTKKDLEKAIKIVADWWATPNGTPHIYMGVQNKDDANLLADEIAYTLKLGTRVTGPKATVSSEYAVVIDREKS